MEHPFLRVKHQEFDYAKVRYRGLAKNTQRLALLLGLGNLLTGSRHLTTWRDDVRPKDGSAGHQAAGWDARRVKSRDRHPTQVHTNTPNGSTSRVT